MYVPTEPASSEVVIHFPFCLILKISEVFPSFSTIKTFFPPGILKATEFKLPLIVLEILTEPAGTNLEAWAMI